MTDSISIVTLTHNKQEVTQRCVSSWLRTDYPSWELIVVDNGSTDGTRQWLEHFREKARRQAVSVTVIANARNVGCSTARNQGLAVARGEKIVFMDNDVALRHRSWLRRLAAVLDEDASVVLVGPKLVYPYPPFAIQCAGAAVSRSGRVQFVGRGEPRDAPRFNIARDVQCLISACMMGRTAAIRNAGGFDEAFNPVEYEDLDLCYRLRSKGWRVRYDPRVEMYHLESVTTAGTPSLPNTYLIVKHGMLFKQRWRHMFEKEKGPADADTRWRNIPPQPLASLQDPPVLD